MSNAEVASAHKDNNSSNKMYKIYVKIYDCNTSAKSSPEVENNWQAQLVYYYY